VVLETLWRNQPISRKDLAEHTHLTAATLTNIIAEFIALGIVQEIGPGESGLGRRPTLLTFVSNSAYLVGVNLSRTDLSVGVFNIALECLHLISKPITIQASESAPEMLYNLIRTGIEQSQIDPQRLSGIGISAPGPHGMKDGIVFSYPRFGEWSNLPLGKLMAEAFSLPVWLENDANANALAEHWLGAGRRYDNFVYIENHSGLGAGIVLHGQLFTGSQGVAGELGHTSIDRHGPRCECGNYGCVELYTSGAAIVKYVRQAVVAGQSTSLIQTVGSTLDTLTFDHVIDAALEGDALAVDAIQTASRALGFGLVNMINLIDPDAVIIGHKISRAGEICMRPIREIVQQQAFPQAAARLNVILSEVKEPVGVTGAACRALSGILEEPGLLLQESMWVE
jgi:glucokinase-like ROK family protein